MAGDFFILCVESLKETTESMMRLSKKSSEMEKDYVKVLQEKTDLGSKVSIYSDKIEKLEKADAGATEQLESLKKQVILGFKF